MPLTYVYVNDNPNYTFQMTSSWSYEAHVLPGTSYNSLDQTKLVGPSEATANLNFSYSLPSGARILGARVSFKVANSVAGISSLTVNGNCASKRGDGSYSTDVALASSQGVFTAVVKFRSNATTTNGSATAQFSGIYLEIDNDGVEGEDGEGSSSATKGYPIPPQSVCIFDQTDNNIYMFDGVLKIQHALSMDMQEEVSGDKAVNYVNNAKNEPDKLTLDVMMSDVYTTEGALITNAGSFTAQQSASFTATKYSLMKRDSKNPWSRSENAFYTLHWLKEERHRLSVITPQFVHVDMILTTVTVNQEESTPFGWEGQLVFQHAFPAKSKKQEKKTGAGDGDGGETPGAIEQLVSGLRNLFK